MSMKSNQAMSNEAWTRPVDAASPPFMPAPAPAVPALSSPRSAQLGTRRRHANAPPLRLTQRDHDILHLVLRAQTLTADQIQTAYFSAGGRSRCQLRLKMLYEMRCLDRLPGRLVNEPDTYILSRRSVAGNRLLRQLLGEVEFRRLRGHLGPLQHLLAVNEVRVRVLRGCRDLSWSLVRWQRPHELLPLLRAEDLLPDAYLQVQRTVDGQNRTAGFFLELERAAKSSQVLASKLRRYRELYYSGRYAQLFGTRALRLLVVFAGSPRQSGDPRVEEAVEQARKLGVSIARVVALDTLKCLPPTACLNEPVWFGPGSCGPVALFPQHPSDTAEAGAGKPTGPAVQGLLDQEAP